MTGLKVQGIKTDHGGEYRSKSFLQELENRGIAVSENITFHSETYAIAERANLILSTMA